VVFEATYLISEQHRIFRQVVSSLFIVLVCVAIMSTPFVFDSGVVFDTRTIIISITSLVFGPIPAYVTMAVAILLRWSIGGVGLFPGVLTILSSGIIGLLWRKFFDPVNSKSTWKNVYLMSVVVHLVMMACQLLLPYPQNLEVIRQVAVPVMVLYPIVSTILTLLLLRQRDFRQMQVDLGKSEEKYRAMFHSAGTGICNTDLQGKIIDANQRFIDILGYSKEELAQRTFEDLTHPDDLGITEEVLKKLFRGEIPQFVLEKRYIAKDGHTVYAGLSVALVRDKDGNPLYTMTTIQDITDVKIQQEQIRYMFDHDTLTDLHNRRHFTQEKTRLDKAQALPLTVVLVNINGLRLINEAYGKEVGDRCILETARILKEVFGKLGDICRVSGDEFWLLLPNVKEAEGRSRARKVEEMVAQGKVQVLDQSIGWSLSIGIAERNSMGIGLEDTLKMAEDMVENKRLLSHQSSRSNLISAMMVTLAERSHETESHGKRLATICQKIGERLELSEREQDKLALFSVLHDVGKIAIDSRILNKPGKLTEEEWHEMKKHPEIGFRIASSAPNLEPIAMYILTHHERWDGTGYPRGLEKEAIPLLARILSLADAYDAMTEDRVYRQALTRTDAMEEIRNNLGTQFDPVIGRLFMEILKENEYL
jgi:PAS domain S-box-containing protein/diguanylate cyclase (GGDEF)-like protein